MEKWIGDEKEAKFIGVKGESVEIYPGTWHFVGGSGREKGASPDTNPPSSRGDRAATDMCLTKSVSVNRIPPF